MPRLGAKARRALRLVEGTRKYGMKRFSLVVLLLVLVAASPFAADIGVGGSVGFFTELFSASDYYTGNSETLTSNSTPLDAYVFAGSKYLELRVGYLKISNIVGDYSGENDFGHPQSGTTGDPENASFVSAAGFFKIPIDFGGVFLFPMIGAEYDYNLTLTDAVTGANLRGSFSNLFDLNQFWIKGGVGAEIKFGGVFVRPEVLYGIKILNQTDSNNLSSFEENGGYSNGMLNFDELDLDVEVGAHF